VRENVNTRGDRERETKRQTERQRETGETDRERDRERESEREEDVTEFYLDGKIGCDAADAHSRLSSISLQVQTDTKTGQTRQTGQTGQHADP
jgi:hypothetical protein